MIALVHQPVIELFVALARRAHVNVKVIDLGVGLFVNHVRELERVHAADLGAVLVIVLIAAAHAVHNADGLGRRHSVAQHHLALGRPGGVGHALKLQAGKDVRKAPVAVLRDAPRVEQIVARRQDDVADFDFEECVLLFKINRAGGAEFLTRLARALEEKGAVLTVNHRILGHGLREGAIDSLAIAQPGLEHLVHHLLGTFFRADAAAGAQSPRSHSAPFCECAP